MKNSLYRSYKYIVLALLIYMPIFGFIDIYPVRIWDEARTALNAYEMYTDGDFIVSHYHGEPDMWNTKPPLLLWLQVFSMHLVGINELAIRLPSALATLCICIAIMLFSKRYLKSFWFGFISVILLMTSEGFVGTHVSRTGDYDALLTFFTTSGCLFFFCFSETKKTKFLYLFFAAALFAALTKGIAGLLCFPALAIYALVQNQLKLFLKNKHFYIGLFSFLIIAVGYYFLREAKNPGYLDAIRDNELGGRFANAQGNQKFDFWFYFNNFRIYRLPDRYLLIPCGLFIGLFSRDTRIRKFAIFLLIVVLTYFLIISSAKTKLEWYDAQLYPFLSIIIAFLIHFLFDLLKNTTWVTQRLTHNVLPFLFLFLILITPYQKIWAKTFYPDEYSWEIEFYEIGYYLKAAVKGKYDLNNKYLAYDGYSTHNYFYIKLLQDRGVKTGLKFFKDLKKGDEVIVCQENVKQYIKEHYAYHDKYGQANVTLFTIDGIKPPVDSLNPDKQLKINADK